MALAKSHTEPKGVRRIRVLRIAHASLTPALRGRERGIATTFPEVDLEVIAPRKWLESGVEVHTEPDDLFPVRTAQTYFSGHMQLFGYDPKVLVEALREHRPHIIDMDHEPYSVPCAEILTIRNLYSPQVPIVMQTAQNILKRYPLPFSLLERRALNQVSAAYMCSETVREVLEAKGFDKPTRIVPFGVDLDMFKFRPRTNGAVHTVGFVGRLLPAKGVSLLIDALSRTNDKKWRLLIVGDGEQRVQLEKTITEGGFGDRVEFTGAVRYEDVPQFFAKMDVLVVPTITTKKIREQFGRVIVEAMASGVPVIGSTCGAIPEVIGDAGLIFDEGSVEGLTTNLLRFFNDSGLRAALAVKGRRRVEQRFTWKRVAHGIFELYREVLGCRDGSADINL